MAQKVSVRVLCSGPELQRANGGASMINQLFFADDTALVADSDKLYRLVSKFGSV